ncbi:hypothetical protein [Bacillus cereus group sp. N21]|uniref:hypothetical protein n=1 Tax=Bacillus cereus group sp. N21 TaxID=2794591 RepID=UPI0018F6D747|nr:hypothetical protein [Bacillus cereus group sp. N21]MBJ8030708.1 hypothetical protein [Bacillus cereus group sp. N21]
MRFAGMVANMFSEESRYFNVVNGPLVTGETYDLGILLKYSVFGMIDGVFVTEHEYCGEIEGFHIFSRYCDMRKMFIVSEMTTGGIISHSPVSVYRALLKARRSLRKNKEKALKIMKKHQERCYVNILVEDMPEHLRDKVIEKQRKQIEKRNPVQGFFEDYDGQIILSDVRNFKSKKEFVEQAEKYLLENKSCQETVIKPHVTNILVGEEEWKPADDPDFEGEEITVYCAEVHSEN